MLFRSFVFMEPTSPKGHDLQRDNRYALHCAVNDSSGASGEFVLTGQARLITDPGLRELATKLSSYAPEERYILFEFEVGSAASTAYPEHRPVRQFWRRA